MAGGGRVEIVHAAVRRKASQHASAAECDGSGDDGCEQQHQQQYDVNRGEACIRAWGEGAGGH